ncbi:NAD(P)/FAD-dependent oxidoreductase [Rhodosalinus halophilus]|uniref:Pyridine nucleotide-disulfide oxidoreductase domain-containing protein 2 n=1 Tax=Rhodosalinus halophilus TaxID=2259333 RepID=A0A365U587_9RHOB|nr:NAD(P)/FAD-dependent oxidoreductase [Rhodosalinus halophilus]RBI83493.1 NAD(P)/FAD-dependent oxidoreductase [Rhodosalinus halophilus]
MSARYDAVVVGGGHNGLVAAATLARAGRRVCVLERADRLGGMAAGGAFPDGTPMPRIAHLLYNLSPAVLNELGFGAGGPVETRALPTVCLDPEGRHVVVRDGSPVLADGRPHPEAEAYRRLAARLVRFGGLLARLADAPPPQVSERLADLAGMRRLGPLAALGWDFRKLGRGDRREFLRIVLSNAHDVILDELSDGPLAGSLAADAVRGAWAGPRAPGTVFSLMYRLARGGGAALPLGGMDAVIAALADRARSLGAALRTGAEVTEVRVEGDRACGVRLADGEEIAAGAVLVATAPGAAMRLAGPAHYDIEAVRRLRNMRAKGTAAKLNLRLDGLPEVPGLGPELLGGRLLLAPSVEQVERAFDPVKYGRVSEAPVIEAVIPSLTDPQAAPHGGHVLSAIVQYVPHAPEGGWTGAARDRLRDVALAALETALPGLSARVTAAETLTPSDIEAATGAPGGHWHHGELSLDQLLTVRPVNGMARYRFGPAGHYLCGAGAHPGGDVMGAPGRNAARVALADATAGEAAA